MTNITIRKLGLGAAGLSVLAAAALVSNILPLITHAQTVEPAISAVSAAPTDTSAAITWTTDEPSNSQVGFGTTIPYSSFSTLDSTEVTSHSVQLTGLTPDTTYHFDVLSQDASNTLATSSDQTFLTTGPTSTTTATTSLPVISSIVASPTDTSATITWNTDQPAMSQVAYGITTNYSASSTLDTNLVTGHSVTLSGLTADTTYHFQVVSGTAMGTANSPDETFMTNMSTVVPPATTTPDITTLQNEITDLQNRVTTLEQEVTSLLSGGNGGSTTTPSTGPSTIDQNGQTFPAGGTVDFGGRNFGHEETVTVMMGGAVVATAHADGGGNFSTGSISLPSVPGSYTYLFVGQSSGKAANATITVQ